ncbi:MAG: hypothetical protein AAB363_06740 [Planctomycetota bacterium]
MTTSTTLEVKVIFDASSRGRRRPTRRVGCSPRVSRSSPWIVLGLLNFLAAGGLYYATWWRVDPFIYLTLMLKTPVDVDLNMAAGIFVPRPTEPREQTPPPSVAPSYTGRTAQMMIGGAAYGWLTLATLAACTLSASAGAAIGRIGGLRGRRVGTLLALTLTLVLAIAALVVWNQFGRHYLPIHLRMGMGGLVLVTALIGLALGRAARGLARLAAITLILSAVGTVAGLYLGSQCGAIPPAQSAPLYLALAFLIHSGYGWIQLPILARLGR